MRGEQAGSAGNGLRDAGSRRGGGGGEGREVKWEAGRRRRRTDEKGLDAGLRRVCASYRKLAARELPSCIGGGVQEQAAVLVGRPQSRLPHQTETR